jgi:error-prone DNA polymerase
VPDPPDRKVHEHPHRSRSLPAAPRRIDADVAYAELAVTSNFTFLTGASFPDELVTQAANLGYRAVALTDRNTLAGVVRAHVAARQTGVQLIVGCRLVFAEPEGLSVLVYPTDRAAYGRLSTLLTRGKRRAAKGRCDLAVDDLLEASDGLLAVVLPFGGDSPEMLAGIDRLCDVFDDDRLSLAVARLYEPKDAARSRRFSRIASRRGVPLVAVNDVHYHAADRRPLQDVLTCIRCGCTLAEAGFRLLPTGSVISSRRGRWPGCSPTCPPR